MVLGQLLEMAVTEAVGPRIADPRDVDAVLAKLGQNDGGAHVRVFGDQSRAAQDLRVHLGDGLANRLLDLSRFLLFGGEPPGDRLRDQLHGHETGLFTGLLPSHAVGHDEQVCGIEGHRRHLGAAAVGLSGRTGRRPGT